jgi:hypothetical protein
LVIVFFESMAKLKYLGTRVTYQYFLHDKNKGRLNSGTDCYHTVESPFFHFLPEKLNI